MRISHTKKQKYEPVSPNKLDRLVFRDTQLPSGSRANLDVAELAERIVPIEVRRGIDWISGRTYASGFTSYYPPNAPVPGAWIRGDSNYFPILGSKNPRLQTI